MSSNRNNQRDDPSFLLSSSPEWVSPMTSTNNVSNEPEWGSHNSNRDFEGSEHFEEDDISPSRSLATSSVREDFTFDFFRPLLQSDIEARASALESIMGLLEDSLKTEKRELIRVHLTTIVRFSSEVPYDDLTSAFQKLVRQIEEHGISTPKPRISPSAFVPSSLFPPLNTIDPIYHQFYVDLFLQTGRVSHLNRVLLLHPSYFDKYFTSFNFIMREAGPLPFSWRNYIAILAASRHQCKWLIFLQEKEFIGNGGEPEWLRGIEHIPKKLGNLLELLQILSHQPWLLTKEHISALVRGEDSWSIGELVHAMIIIVSIKAACGIIFGSGVTPEIDMDELHTNEEIVEQEHEEEMNAYSDSGVRQDTDKIMELLRQWEMNEPEDQGQEYFVKAESETLSKPQNTTAVTSDVSRYIGSFDMTHADFDVHAKNYHIFRVQDYCWKEHGFELVRRFLPDSATLLDEEFDHIYTMTYNMFSQNQDIDTFPFRRAIWQYVQRVKGMFHDDYNYQEVNVFLNKGSKSFIKKITCQAQEITKSDFTNLGYVLKPDEKVHVAALAVESAKQSELLYGLHALMQHMYNR